MLPAMKLLVIIGGFLLSTAAGATEAEHDDGTRARDANDERHPFLRHAAAADPKFLGGSDTLHFVPQGSQLNAENMHLASDFMLNPGPSREYLDQLNKSMTMRQLAGTCTKTTVDFSKSASGATLSRGMYVSDEWKELGLTLSSIGGYGRLPRLFDTARVGNKDYGDTDLGAPNQRCPGGGPGIGEGGEPDTSGANCSPLGNVLIIQEVNDHMEIPDDNVGGGLITMKFDRENGQTVYEIGLLDVDYEATIRIRYKTDTGRTKSKYIRVPILGDNSVQTVAINTPNVVKLTLDATRSAAITFISFCPVSDKAVGPPPPPPPPPQQSCVDRFVDFSKSASGTPLTGGSYVQNEWAEFGLTLSSTGGFGEIPRLFDTAHPGTEKKGDPDLGAPNEKCPNPGPGVGDGGVPGALGENCKALGNVLIIQEVNDHMDIPDDNEKGGSIKFDFGKTWATVYEIGLLDVDYDLSITVVYHIGGSTAERTINVPKLGDNSVQKVVINETNVKHVQLNASRSGAVTHISFCSESSDKGRVPDSTSPPVTPAPSPEPTKKTPSPVDPTESPTPAPSVDPTLKPTPSPTPGATPQPETPSPTPGPTPQPETPSPTPGPTSQPETPSPTSGPTPQPETPSPTPGPTSQPETPSPTPLPTKEPTPSPTPAPINPGGLALETSVLTVDRSDATAVLDVVRTEGSDGSVSVDYATQPDTATPGDDYTATNGTLMFADGETRKSIVIPLLSSASTQGTERFKVMIDNPVGADLLAPRTATVVLEGEEDVITDPLPPLPTEPDEEEYSIKAVDLIDDISQPVNLAWLPDDTMLIASKGGVVYVANSALNSLESTPFIDIKDVVNNIQDRGLISIAVHPNFANNPYVYLLYTYEGDDDVTDPSCPLAGPDKGGNRAGRLIRVTADAATDFKTHVAGSQVILVGKNSTRQYFNPCVDSTVDFDEPQGGYENGAYVTDFINSDSKSHSVGALAFHPDGSLLVSTGDGASYNRVDNRAWRVMDVNSLTGKVLRIDPITGEGLPSNPYYSLTNDPNANSAKVYQSGIRNSFRMAVDKTTGQFYLGEVGWSDWEEINTGLPGANYGWPYYQGSSVNNAYANTADGQAWAAQNVAVTDPLYELSHEATGINAIVLGDKISSTYYGTKYEDNLIFNDYGQGIVRYMSFDGGNVEDVDVFTTVAENVVSIQEGPDGFLYYCSIRQGIVGRLERE